MCSLTEDVTFTKRHHTLTLYSRHRKKEYGTVRIQVSLVGDKVKHVRTYTVHALEMIVSFQN